MFFSSFLPCQAEHGAGLSKSLVVGLQVKPMAQSGLTLQVSLDGRAAKQDLIIHAGEKGNRRLCQSHQLFDSRAWIIQGTKTISRPLT